MQNIKQTESRGLLAFVTKLDVRTSGATVAAADLTDQDTVLAGTVIGKDTNGLFHVIKSAKLYASATNVATTYQVLKGHNAKVGDVFGIIGDAAYAISAINTSNAAYDVFTLGTTLGVALSAGDILTQATAAAADNAALAYTPIGMVGFSYTNTSGDSNLAQVVLRGCAIESNIPPIHATVKALLPQITYSV
jgi:hypothetical protein